MVVRPLGAAAWQAGHGGAVRGRPYDQSVTDIPTHWTVRHFSQANPFGPGCDSVPALLRRLADSVEDLGPVEVQDVVISSEMTEHGAWRSGTVYFHLPEDDEDD